MFRALLCIVALMLVAAPQAHAGETTLGVDQRVDAAGNIVPFKEAVKWQSFSLPPKVEGAIATGYGVITFTTKTTGGAAEQSFCGAGLYDKTNRLIITSQHCLPEYVALLSPEHIRFRTVRATYVESLPEADLAMFQLDSVEGMEELGLMEAVVGEPVYLRSLQQVVALDPTLGKSVPLYLYYYGPVCFEGSVIGKGQTYVGPKDGNTLPIPTKYQLLHIHGESEPGFSGGPIYNQWGKVVGIVMSGKGDKTFATSALNIIELLKKYRPK